MHSSLQNQISKELGAKLGARRGLTESDMTSNQNQHQPSESEHVGAWPQMPTTEMFQKEQPDGEWSESHQHLATLPTAHTNGTDHTPDELPSTKTSRKMTGFRTALGLHPLAPIDETHDAAPHQDLVWSKIRLTLREPFSEFLGTMILVLFGNGSVAQVLLSTGDTLAPGGNGFGAYQSISWAWGLGTVRVQSCLLILVLTFYCRCSASTSPAIVGLT